MRIFITGGTGFIGSYLIPKLTEGKNKVLVLTRNPKNLVKYKEATCLKGDLSKISEWKKELKRFKPEAVIHLAWKGIPDYSSPNSITNLKYGLDLLQTLATVGCKKILVTGSLWEYGLQKGKLSEKISVNPFNAFTAAKNSLNWVGSEFAKEHNIVFLWVRLFYVYGPGQKKNSLIPYLISCAKENKKPEIRNPNAQNDFIFVEDVAEAIYQILLKSNKSDTFNIGSGKLTSIQYIIESISKTLGIKGYQVGNKERIDDYAFSYADISKIKSIIGWKPQINIDEGIKRILTGFLYQDNRNNS